MSEKKDAYCNKLKKWVNDIDSGECHGSCSDYSDGKPCQYFEAITQEEYNNRWRK